MADIRVTVDQAQFCIKSAQLILHGVRRNPAGQIIDHVDVVLPWAMHGQLVNLDGIDYRSIDELR